VIEERSIPVSVVILCHNEACNLERCIAALRGCAEIVVLDDGSTDGSQALAQSLGARVVHHRYVSFADQRNWAMDHAELAHDWVLHLDADEVVTGGLLNEVGEIVDMLGPSRVGFVARKMILDGRWLRRCADYPVFVARLVHRRGPRFVMRGHGEVIDAPPTSPIYLQGPFLHYVFSKGWDDWYARHEQYAKAEARRIVRGLPPLSLGQLLSPDRTVRRSMIRALSYRLPARPWQRFIYSYVLRCGFLDGGRGWQFCRAMVRYERMIDVELKRCLSEGR
jgi:glycosyltransferase involved in cell wall biosynthesis